MTSTKHLNSLRLKEGSVLHEILERCAKKVVDDQKTELRSQAISEALNPAPKYSSKTRQDT